MATLADLIERARSLADDNPLRDTLNGSISSSVTSLTFTSGADIGEQPKIVIDLETLVVTDKPTVTTATVTRGAYGTTAATHANLAEVLVAARYTNDQYRKAINAALSAISHVFGKTVWDSTQSFASSKGLLSVPATALRVFEVGLQPTGSTDIDPVPFRFERSLPTGIVATGRGVRLTGYNPGSGAAHIGYELPWPELTTLAGALDSLYPADAVDLIDLGAWAYLEDSDQFKRGAFTAAHPRAGVFAVSEGATLQLARASLQRFLARRFEVATLYAPKQNFGWVKR